MTEPAENNQQPSEQALFDAFKAGMTAAGYMKEEPQAPEPEQPKYPTVMNGGAQAVCRSSSKTEIPSII